MYILISEYATSALILANIIIEIFLTAQRLALVAHTSFCIKKVRVKTVCLFILSATLLAYLPVLFMNTIEPVRDPKTNEIINYRLGKTRFGRHKIARVIVVFLTGTRITLVTIVLFALSASSVVIFYRFYKQKSGFRSTASCIDFFIYLFFNRNINIKIFIYLLQNQPSLSSNMIQARVNRSVQKRSHSFNLIWPEWRRFLERVSWRLGI
jgi:hypothetical protein